MRRLADSPDHGIRSVQLVVELSVLVVFVVVLQFRVEFVVEFVVVEFLVVEFLVVAFVIIVWIVELERVVQFGELKLVDADSKQAWS